MPVQFFKQTIAVLASASDTNGVRGAVEVASPRGAVPPLHVHHREDEAIYVLDGEYSVFIGDDVIKASPGAWVWGPRGVPYGYQIHSEREDDAEVILFSPTRSHRVVLDHMRTPLCRRRSPRGVRHQLRQRHHHPHRRPRRRAGRSSRRDHPRPPGPGAALRARHRLLNGRPQARAFRQRGERHGLRSARARRPRRWGQG
ncbi:MAG: cupin domain-containing protein [Ilumatobacteraceae bacterium]